MALKNYDISVNLYDDKAKIHTGITVDDTVHFTCSILDKEGHTVDLTEVNIINVFVKKHDNSEYQDACWVGDTTGESLKLINPEEGIIGITLDGAATSSPGVCYATISFYDDPHSEKATTGRFAYYVKEGTATNDFARVSEYKSLDSLIALLATYKSALEQMQYYLGLYEGALNSIENRDGLATLESLYNFVPKTQTLAGLELSGDISKAQMLAALGLTGATAISYPISIDKGGTGYSGATLAGLRQYLGITDQNNEFSIQAVDISSYFTNSTGALSKKLHKSYSISAWYYPQMKLVVFESESTERNGTLSPDNDALADWFDCTNINYRPAVNTALAVSAPGGNPRRAIVSKDDGSIRFGNSNTDLGVQAKVRIAGTWRVR